MVEKVVNQIVKMMLDEQIITDSEKEEYTYSISSIIENSITISSIMVISCILKNIISTIGFLLFFLALRKRTGGFHTSTFGQCYLMTLIVYGIVVYFCHKLMFWQRYHWIGMFVSAIIILIIGSVNHPNIHMTKHELKSAKEAARWMLVLEVGVICFLKWMHVNPVTVTYLSTAVTLCGILLCFAKMIGQEVKANE